MNIKTDLEFQLRRYCYNICTMNILFETQLVVVPGSNKNKQNCSDLECWVSPAPMLWSGHCCQYCHCLTVSGSGRCRVKTALRSRVLILPDPEQSGTYTHSAWSPALTTLSCSPPSSHHHMLQILCKTFTNMLRMWELWLTFSNEDDLLATYQIETNMRQTSKHPERVMTISKTFCYVDTIVSSHIFQQNSIYCFYLNWIKIWSVCCQVKLCRPVCIEFQLFRPLTQDWLVLCSSQAWHVLDGSWVPYKYLHIGFICSIRKYDVSITLLSRENILIRTNQE